MSDASFYFHDYETWGANPHYDRPSQFAGLRTNLELEPCDRPLTIFSQPTPDFLPHPQAVLVTGITPQFALAQGTNEASFAAAIAAQMSVPNTTIIGYNNIAFDDEVTRHLFYRNFHDPYAHTWQQQNSRWDLIDLMRACYALRPEGIEWPYHDDGRVSMRLEDLSKANGIEHANAHDAMADVHATIGMARKVKQAQPRLFAYAYGLRRKQAVQQLINLVNFEPRVHISGFYGALNGYVSVIMPLGYHPEQPNTLLYWDLRHNPLEFLESSLDDLVERRFTPRKQLAENGLSAFAGGTLQLNRCPFIAKLNVLDSTAQQRWNLDLEQLERHRQTLLAQSELRDRLCQALLTSKTYDAVTDPDFMLYSGPFFSEQDRSNMDIIRNTAPEQLPGLTLNFSDSRLPEMLFRYRARNYPSTLTDSELLKWREFCQGRLLSPPPGGLSAERFMQELELAAQQHSDNTRNMRLLNDLLRYAQSL